MIEVDLECFGLTVGKSDIFFYLVDKERERKKEKRKKISYSSSNRGRERVLKVTILINCWDEYGQLN